jgi:hypothetical protein
MSDPLADLWAGPAGGEIQATLPFPRALSQPIVSPTCPLCRVQLASTIDPVRSCEGCRTEFHADCLQELGGCSTPGCPERGTPVGRGSTAGTLLDPKERERRRARLELEHAARLERERSWFVALKPANGSLVAFGIATLGVSAALSFMIVASDGPDGFPWAAFGLGTLVMFPLVVGAFLLVAWHPDQEPD